jgi:hypothetical protein
MTLPPALLPALAKLVRLLGTDKDGELVAAVHAMKRVLAGSGNNLHDLAAVIEAPSVVPGTPRDDDEFLLPCRGMVATCSRHAECFTTKEREFLRSLARWRGKPTPKQIGWLLALYERVRRAA